MRYHHQHYEHLKARFWTHHKSSSELVGLPDLGDDQRVEDDDQEVRNDFDEEKLWPEDVVGHVDRVDPQVARKDLVLVGVVHKLKDDNYLLYNSQNGNQCDRIGHFLNFLEAFFKIKVAEMKGDCSG